MAAEEESYAALMVQAKSSLARIKELEEGLDRVRKSSQQNGEDTSMGRAAELLSRIEALEEVGGAMETDEGARQRDENVEGEDSVMEETDRVEQSDKLEYRTGAEDKTGETVEMETDTLVEDGNFPELMERAKKLLARVTMDGDDQKAAKEIEAQARHDRAVAELWGSM